MQFTDLNGDMLCLISNYLDNPLIYPLDCLSTKIQHNIYTGYNIKALKLGIDFINKPFITPLIGENDKTIKSFVELINIISKKYPYQNNKYIKTIYIKINFHQQLIDKNNDMINNLLIHKNLSTKGNKNELKIRLFNDYLKKLSNLQSDIFSYIINTNTSYIYHLIQLKGFHNLGNLFLRHTQVSGDIACLSELHNLTDIRLHELHITGDIASLKELRNLITLYLWKTQVYGDIGALSELRKLTVVDLYKTQVSGDIASLSNLQNLTRLCLLDTKVTGNRLALQKQLPNNIM